MNLSIVLNPYEVLQQDTSCIRLKIKKEIATKSLIVTGVLVPSLFVAFFVLKNEIVYLIPILLLLLPYLRMLQIRDPNGLFVQKGQLVLTYKKCFGGEREMAFDASIVSDIVPDQFCTSKGEYWIAAVRVDLSNGKTKRIFSAPRGKYEIATLHSEIVAGILKNIFTGNSSWQNALTTRSS